MKTPPPEVNPITLDDFIAQLQKAREVVGGQAKVCACVPYEHGPGWRYEWVINAHSHNGNVDIPVTLNYRLTP